MQGCVSSESLYRIQIDFLKDGARKSLRLFFFFIVLFWTDMLALAYLFVYKLLAIWFCLNKLEAKLDVWFASVRYWPLICVVLQLLVFCQNDSHMLVQGFEYANVIGMFVTFERAKVDENFYHAYVVW